MNVAQDKLQIAPALAPEDMDPSMLRDRANALLRKVLQGCQSCTQDSHTSAIYDSAWLSMIAKKLNGELHWLFPECFQFVMENQQSNGGWQSCDSDEDGLLSTLAALLALKRHSKPLELTEQESYPDLEAHIERAFAYLEATFRRWNIKTSSRVGFEILVPAHLRLLEQEGIFLDFPQRANLMASNDEKLRMFNPSHLYGSHKTTLLHSLEAFVGIIDYDLVQHHLNSGSQMNSPSSTAAYLMNCSKWDPEAEDYLRGAVRNSHGQGDGGVPSVYPSNIFELTWTVSTLIAGGFSKASLDPSVVRDTISYLDEHLQLQQGLLGFAPSALADADDTSKALLTLSMLGRNVVPDQLISSFETKGGHFVTYNGERNSSFSANCNVLMAILCSSEPDRHISQVENITDFLCDSWCSGSAKDKWNTSPYYCMMLLAQTFMQLLFLWDDSRLQLMHQDIIQNRINRVLMQVLNRTLLSQNTNGTWDMGKSPEIDAYAILTLLALGSLPQAKLIRWQILSAIQNGRQALESSEADWSKPRYLWIEKVTYGSRALSESYCLAAMHGSFLTHEWSSKMKAINNAQPMQLRRITQFICSLTAYSVEPDWKILTSVIEGFSYLPQLTQMRSEIFPARDSSEEIYLNFIPCSWTVVNNLAGLFLDANLLWDMMVISMLNFQVDAYMESIIAGLHQEDISALTNTIRIMCESLPTEKQEIAGKAGASNDISEQPHTPDRSYKHQMLEEIKRILLRYVAAVLDHPHIQDAASNSQHALRTTMQAFLLSHIEQNEDNSRFRSQDPTSCGGIERFRTPRATHHTWSHTTAATNTSCPYSFRFFLCHTSVQPASGPDCLQSGYQKYLAEELCSHLAVMTRLYNDYGSISRDRAESNLNTVNFPEFHPKHDDATEIQDDHIKETEIKSQLLALARYERSSVSVASQALIESLMEDSANGADSKFANTLRLFIGATEFYADVYVARDLGIRMK